MSRKRKPFYEEASFVALDKEWKQKLRDDGFEDIESPSGLYLNQPRKTIAFLEHADGQHADGMTYDPTDPLIDMIDGENEEEVQEPEPLHDADLWEDLDPRARRAWGLVVLTGWSPKRAAEHLGLRHQTVNRWFKTVRKRLHHHG